MRTAADGLLHTDQYQLAMGQTYFDAGIHARRAHFEYFFRSYPDYGGHRAGFCVFAGLGPLLDWMERVRLTAGDIDSLRGQRTPSGDDRFSDTFLTWLEGAGHFGEIDVTSVSEGRIVHPGEPVLTAEGPLAILQLLETALLNRLNYPTLIATKAARVKLAAAGRPVLEFGLRRGPVSGAADGTRAALIGGADFSSNVAISRHLGVDPKGTHAHAMVQAFLATGGSELDAFRAFAESHPDECILLLDTVDTLESGLPNALRVFGELEARGHRPAGVRLDSGDPVELVPEVSRRLDAAGFADAQIVVSSDLDEREISTLVVRIRSVCESAGSDPSHVLGRLAYGVGTRLITSHGAPALGGVFKLVAVEGGAGWKPVGKRSDTPSKAVAGGRKGLWRAYGPSGEAVCDVVGPAGRVPDFSAPGGFDASELDTEPLRGDVFAAGRRSRPAPDLAEMRANLAADLAGLPEGSKGLVDPSVYPVVRAGLA